MRDAILGGAIGGLAVVFAEQVYRFIAGVVKGYRDAAKSIPPCRHGSGFLSGDRMICGGCGADVTIAEPIR